MIVPVIEFVVALAFVLTAVPAGWYAFALTAPLIVAHTGIAEPFGPAGPFWRYHWERFRLAEISYLWGLALFAGLTALLIGLAVWGFLYNSPFARGALVGAWVADAILSHVLLRAVFTGPNPGLRTSLLYLLAAPCVLYWFTVDPLGVVLGAGPFVAFHAVAFAARYFRPSPGV